MLAANRPTYAAAYGATVPVFDTFSGLLQTDGETSRWSNRAQTPLAMSWWRKFARLSALPWPATTNGFGNSLQLIDPRQDNWRAGNWTKSCANRNSRGDAIARTASLPAFPAALDQRTSGRQSDRHH